MPVSRVNREDWKVAEHGPLTQVAEGLFTVDAKLDLLPIGRRMVIVRGAGGSLAVHSAIACDELTMQAIEQLGVINYIVVPSASHRIDAPRFAGRYPDAQVLTPDAARPHVERVVRVADNYDPLQEHAGIEFEMLEGVPTEGVLRHRDSQGQVTLIFNDALMNLPDRLPGFKGFLTRVMGSTGGPKVTPTARKFIVRSPRLYAQHLRRLAETKGLARVIVGHGSSIERDVPETLLRVAATLD